MSESLNLKMQTATQSFERHYDNSQKLLEEISAKIEELKVKQKTNPKNWGYAGSMENVEELLSEVSNFFGGE